MLLAYDGDDRATVIANLVPALARERADRECPGDWTSGESFSDYQATLRSMEAWTEGPEWNRVVVARPRLAPTSGAYSHLAAEIVDVACDRVDTDGYTFRHGMIVPEGHEARVVWTHKPNLDRLQWHSAFDISPMIAFRYEGRVFTLGGEGQNIPAYVANRYPYRHGVGRKMYGHDVLLFARMLDVAVEDARRIADILVPDRCGLYLERNPAIRILSAAEECAVRRGDHNPFDARGNCGECGAHAGEPCRVQNCQGDWI